MVNVSAGKNDPKSSIVCVYGNRLEGAVYAERTPDKNIQKTVARDGVTEVIIQESCTLFKVRCVCQKRQSFTVSIRNRLSPCKCRGVDADTGETWRRWRFGKGQQKMWLI